MLHIRSIKRPLYSCSTSISSDWLLSGLIDSPVSLTSQWSDPGFAESEFESVKETRCLVFFLDGDFRQTKQWDSESRVSVPTWKTTTVNEADINSWQSKREMSRASGFPQASGGSESNGTLLVAKHLYSVACWACYSTHPRATSPVGTYCSSPLTISVTGAGWWAGWRRHPHRQLAAVPTSTTNC